MTRLIKMEWYKLRTSRLFIVLLAVTFILSLVIAAVVPIIATAIGSEIIAANLSDILSNPFSLGLLMLPVFISAASFMYLDFAGGYVKNIAGQLPDRGILVFAKFIIIGVHNLIFFLIAALGGVLGTALTQGIVVDAAVGAGLLTLALKWLLSMALCSIVMFFAVGLRNKTLAIIIAVVFATNSLSLLYMGVDYGAATLLHAENFTTSNYLPDGLMGSVNAITGDLVVNAIVVSAVFIGLFLWLTYMTFKKRDVK